MADEKEKNTSVEPEAEESKEDPVTNDDSSDEESVSNGTGKQEEVKEEAPSASDDSASDEVEVPEKFKKLVEEIETMSVLELNELVKVLEKKFGVSAVAVAAAGAGGAAEGAAEEKDSFNVELAEVGGNKIAVIKAVKEVSGLGLKEAKDLVEGAPSMIKEGVKKEEAEEIKAKIEEAGGKVNLK